MLLAIRLLSGIHPRAGYWQILFAVFSVYCGSFSIPGLQRGSARLLVAGPDHGLPFHDKNDQAIHSKS